MRRRLTLTLDHSEADALVDLAIREDRDPPRQAARLVREGLLRAGMLPAGGAPDVPVIAEGSGRADDAHPAETSR